MTMILKAITASALLKLLMYLKSLTILMRMNPITIKKKKMMKIILFCLMKTTTSSNSSWNYHNFSSSCNYNCCRSKRNSCNYSCWNHKLAYVTQKRHRSRIQRSYQINKWNLKGNQVVLLLAIYPIMNHLSERNWRKIKKITIKLVLSSRKVT